MTPSRSLSAVKLKAAREAQRWLLETDHDDPQTGPAFFAWLTASVHNVDELLLATAFNVELAEKMEALKLIASTKATQK